jgi:glycosyltransferase involved in cell wall biosynthesis
MTRAVADLARAQAKLGHAVHVATSDAWDESVRRPAGRSVEPEGTVVHVFPNASARLAYAQVYLPLGMGVYLARAAGGVDVVHVHGHRNAPQVAAAIAAARARVPLVMSAHGTLGAIEGRRAAKSVFDAAIGKTLLARVALFFALSEIERETHLAAGIDVSRVRVVPNGLAPAPPAPPGDAGRRFRERFRERHGVPAGAPLVLSVGRIAPLKGLDVAIRALPEVTTPEVRLVLAGNDFGDRARLAALAREFRVDPRVTFIGPIDEAGKAAAFAAADLFVCPSRHEAFGLAPLEAVAAGVPVVLSDRVGLGEYLRKVDGAFHFPDGDAAALAAAIDGALARPAESRKKAARASAWVREDLTWEKVAARIVDGYAEAIAIHRGAKP